MWLHQRYQFLCTLRAEKVLKYSSALSLVVDSQTELPAGSNWEIEIRAASIIAVERIHQAIVSRGFPDLLVLEVDWLLWQIGEKNKESIAPCHRTLTVYD